MERVILHCDCDSYFASVECMLRPELKNVPMAVCGDPAGRRGIVVAKNQLAKKYGVKTTDTVWQAKKKCPNLTLVIPHHDLYGYYCGKINDIYEQYTDQVEAFSIDESWLDVTGSTHMFGTGREIADLLRRRVREEIGITISVGVSYNKIYAKMASDMNKPDGTTVLNNDNRREILYPLPVDDMIFVGESGAQAFSRVGIETIGQLADAPLARVVEVLGKSGETLWAYANGLDGAEVRRRHEHDPAKSVGNSITFPRDLVGADDVRAGLIMLAESVGARLRAQDLSCQTVQVQIKNPSLKVICRQRTLKRPTSLTRDLYEVAFSIIRDAWNLSAPIRMLMLTASGLSVRGETPVQMSLFAPEEEPGREKQEKLEEAVDRIRGRFGPGSITLGRVVKNDLSSPDEMKHD